MKGNRAGICLRSRNDELYDGSGRGYDKGVIDDFRSFLNETGVFECAGHDNAFGVSLAKKDLAKAIDLCNKNILK